VVEEAVDQGDRGSLVGQETAPIIEGPVAGNAEAAALVGSGDKAEEELAAGGVEGSEAELVDEDQVRAEKVVDDPSDRVVGEAAVEGLDEVGGSDVADAMTGRDGGVAECDQQMRLAGPGGPDQAEVLLGANPLEAGQVVEGGLWNRGGLDLELVQALADGEAGDLDPCLQVGLIAGRDLGLDEGAEELVRCPVRIPAKWIRSATTSRFRVRRSSTLRCSTIRRSPPARRSDLALITHSATGVM
jgi:hypothetical protein